MRSGDDKVNILLVDDQPGKLLTYEAILGDLGDNLIKANSGAEALAHLLKEEIAVVLVDVCMPTLDGFELASLIRQHPRWASERSTSTNLRSRCSMSRSSIQRRRMDGFQTLLADLATIAKNRIRPKLPEADSQRRGFAIGRPGMPISSNTQHLKAASLFRDHVLRIETDHMGLPLGAFFEDIRSYASACIMSSTPRLRLSSMSYSLPTT